MEKEIKSQSDEYYKQVMEHRDVMEVSRKENKDLKTELTKYKRELLVPYCVVFAYSTSVIEKKKFVPCQHYETDHELIYLFVWYLNIYIYSSC